MNLKLAFCVSAAMSAAFGFSQVPVTKLTQILAPNAIQTSTNTGPLAPTKTIRVAISLPPTDLAALQNFADSVSNPASPTFHQFITPQQVGAQFGQPLANVQAVSNYLASQGLKVYYISPSHFLMDAYGTVSQVQAAFGTHISTFHSSNALDVDRPNFYSFTSPIQVPTSIAPYISDVAGLQNYSRPRKRILTPNQARVLYGTAPDYNSGFKGQGRSVAISSWDGFQLSNVPLYFAKFNIPGPPTITQVTINGGSGAGTPQGEGDVDIQMVLGMAPLSHFYIYDGGVGSGGNDMLDVISREQSDNVADIISESYGWFLAPSEAESAHAIHLAMTSQGITYMAASGDSGTQLEPFAYPDYDPEVLLVGATEAVTDASGIRQRELTWSGNGAGGGGWTNDDVPFNVRPSWQKGTGVPTTINRRLGPDVALMGGFINGLGAYYFFFQGALDQNVAGTSFSSPVFAGQLAVTEQRVMASGGLAGGRAGRLQDVFYAQNGDPTRWYDVVDGGSTGVLPNGTSALPHPGWDFTTGWGAINWNKQTLAKIKPLPITPTFFGVVEGSNLGDPTTNVNVADGQDFEVAPESVANLGQSASVSYLFTLPPTVGRGTVTGLQFNAIAGFGPGSTGQIYLLNYTTGKFDILRSFAISPNGTSMTATLNTAFTYYISAAGQYRVLLRGLQPLSAGVTTNPFSIDYLASNALVPG